MDDFIIYILKACLGITLFVVPYLFFLRNDNALQLKRFFLLGGVFASFLFPFLSLKRPAVVEVYSSVVNIEPDFVMPQMEAIPVEVATGIEIHWPTVLLALYLCGALILLFRNVFMLIKWNAVWKKAERKVTGVAYSGNDEIFALFSRIFLPDRLQNAKETDSILLHEKAHIRQLHFIDLIIAETTMLLMWFNPFTWLLTIMVKENHEHLADRMVLKEGVDPVEYRTQLLNQTMGIQVFSLAHPFNRSSVKNRFEMMKQSKSMRSGMLKVAVLVPLILISLGMAVGKARQGNTVSGKIVFSDTGEPAHGASVVIVRTTTGTVADDEGNYKLELKERSEVVFSFVGYKTQSHWVNPGEYRFVVLEREIINLIPPVIMIDGVKSQYNSPDEIDHDIIASVKSYDRFGKEGGRDLYIINTKKGRSSKTDSNTIRENDNTDVLRVKPEGKKDSVKTDITKEATVEEVYYVVEDMPKFNNGNPAVEFNKYVAQNLRYPKEEAAKGITGRVLVEFLVNADGSVSDAKVVMGVSSGLNKEAIRVIESSPPWTPGTQRGKAVAVKFSFPVTFEISESEDILPSKPVEHDVFYIVEEMPLFNNGEAAIEFRKYIAENLRYPEEEKNNKKGGRVFIQFTVTPEGSVADVKVISGVSPGLDQEAIRVVESSPAWTPGKQRGKAVSVMFTFPVNFFIVGKESKPAPEVVGWFPNTKTAIDGKDKPPPERVEWFPKTKTAWRKVDQMAEYPGGMGEFRKFLATYLRYPVYAYDNQVDGEVAIEVVVNESGKIILLNEYLITDEKQHAPFALEPVLVVAHSLGVDKQNKKASEMGKNALEQEVLRVLLSSPTWSKSAFKDRKPVAMVMRVSVKFVLQEPGKPNTQSGIPSSELPAGLNSGLPSEAPEFLILVETVEDKIKLSGLKGCAWKELTFTPTIPYIDQNGVTMVPTLREKSDDPDLSTFLFRLARIENKIELTGIKGTDFKKLSWNWGDGECRQLINQNGML